MRQVYRSAGLDPNACGFVEAHGTGTRVGDPIEATAIHNVLGLKRTARDPLLIGSVKSNIGHLEGASGMKTNSRWLSLAECPLTFRRNCRNHQSGTDAGAGLHSSKPRF